LAIIKDWDLGFVIWNLNISSLMAYLERKREKKVSFP
jgi:hypothetical protein